MTAVAEDCVRQSLARVPEISPVDDDWSYPSRKVFRWQAQRATVRTQGFVSLDSSSGKTVLVLVAGAMNHCEPDSFSYGKLMLDAIYDELHATCPGVPDVSMTHQEDIKGCG